jgi:hypothetical protein
MCFLENGTKQAILFTERKIMQKEFIPPDFTNAGLEIRESDTGVEICFSTDGLSYFLELLEILKKDKHDSFGSHIHLEDWEILTPETKRTTLILS